ncbi:MAG: TPM domain-containing protein [Hydrogenophilales bacterium]|nr:TPM domain-containing protein [Hydrogenophilales bacterium]
MILKRLIPHLLYPDWWLKRVLRPEALARIEAAIAASEAHHHGEIRFVVEATLDFFPVWRGLSARERALEVFGRERVWDTEASNGVLIYLLLAERDVEIVADRGFAGKVDALEWETICREMETAFRAKRFEAGALIGIERLDALIKRHFPLAGANPDELENAVTIL